MKKKHAESPERVHGRAHARGAFSSTLPPIAEPIVETELARELLEPARRKLPRPAPSRLRARAAALTLPPRPITYDELLAALRSVSYMSRPRTIVQIERQLRAFALWAVDVPIAEIARRLDVSRETVRNDIHYENLHRAYGPPFPLPERRISLLDAGALFRSWGCASFAEVQAFVRELRDRESPIIEAGAGEK